MTRIHSLARKLFILLLLAAGPVSVWIFLSPHPVAVIEFDGAIPGAWSAERDWWVTAFREGKGGLRGPVLVHDVRTGDLLASYLEGKSNLWLGHFLPSGELWIQVTDDPRRVRYLDAKTGQCRMARS